MRVFMHFGSASSAFDKRVSVICSSKLIAIVNQLVYFMWFLMKLVDLISLTGLLIFLDKILVRVSPGLRGGWDILVNSFHEESTCYTGCNTFVGYLDIPHFILIDPRLPGLLVRFDYVLGSN